jgi:hypothetical protein
MNFIWTSVDLRRKICLVKLQREFVNHLGKSTMKTVRHCISSLLARSSTRTFVLTLGLLLGTAMPSSAATVYTYTGNNFNQLDNTASATTGVAFTNTDHVSGSFTLASALAANQSFAAITALDFSFTNGQHVFTPGNTNNANSYIRLATNGTGLITFWDVSLFDFIGAPPDLTLAKVYSTWFPGVGSGQDGGSQAVCSATCGSVVAVTGGQIGLSPGVWTVETVSAVPEPQEWAMMLAGLGVVSAIARRKAKAFA